MAYTLKSTGLATESVAIYMVDEDGVTLREWVSGQFATWDTVSAWAEDAGNADLTVDDPVTVANATWKGSTLDYFETLANGAYNFYGIRHSSPIDIPGAAGEAGVGVFAALAGAGTPAGNRGALFADSATNAYLGADVSTGILQWYVSSGVRYASTQVLPQDGTTKFSVAGNYKYGDAATQTFHGLESGALAATDAGASPGNYSFSTYDNIGGEDGGGRMPAKYFILAVFNRTLTEAEYQGLHNDYFGTLFDAPADTTAPTFTSGPTAANVAQTSLDIQVTQDEDGNVYAVAVADGAAAPSSAQVKAGQDSTGSAAIASGSSAATADTQATIGLTGLTSNVAYDVYVVGEDGVPNLQTSPAGPVNVTTAAPAVRTVTLAAKDAAGADIADQAGVSAWVYTDLSQAPDAVFTDQSVSAGQIALDVSATGLADATPVVVIAELSSGDVAVADGSVVVT